MPGIGRVFLPVRPVVWEDGAAWMSREMETVAMNEVDEMRMFFALVGIDWLMSERSSLSAEERRRFAYGIRRLADGVSLQVLDAEVTELARTMS
jgi:hypothetical protein